MASIIRVKRSTGTAAPTSINYGELAVTVGLATHGTFGGRLFAGDNTSPNPDPIEVGGKYYTDLIRYNKPGEIREGRNADAGRLSNGFIPVMDRESAGNPGGAGNIVTVSCPQTDLGQPTYEDSDGITMLSLPFYATPTDAGSDEFSLAFT